ncbi:LamB/YcsF family protein [Salisediminibacterium selenitireducens]|uniref:5-oxoprolinase subunit A n=1 Tax=Bacillus selenitireducens (strain ATCC 700615 / DSM 15326 / MLS10) TaxID=439292 RepID=D6Y0B4_BACIE|nr:5-oxoprolinase subunit PxpA [Salisediminibacterium selenitireducens]ADH98505.1 LamB/YcsF family protein [[Bacillus] selenitireducens MLS10]
MRVDINADLGERFGVYDLGDDEGLMDVITSANIACGFHAGDYRTMAETVALATEKGVKIGAHPGYQDLIGFGRRAVAMPADEIHALTVYQIGALDGFCRAHGTQIHHVKPHGALYNLAAVDEDAARAVVRAVSDVVPSAVLVGLAGSVLVNEGRASGLSVAEEVFADRTYTDEGQLTPRTKPNAVLTDPAQIKRQVMAMIEEGLVTSTGGRQIPVQADTICFHGDGKEATALARTVRASLESMGIRILPVGGRG